MTENQKTYTEEQRDLNGRCSVVMHVEDDFISNSRLLEDEIERRGLEEQYVRALYQELQLAIEEAAPRTWYVGWDDIFSLIRATPEQRCRAFLAVTE
jgi:hypothetical protein